MVRLQTTDSDVDPVLDRDPPERTSTVARPRSHTDGVPWPAVFLHVLTAWIPVSMATVHRYWQTTCFHGNRA